jgi:general secretion pathway protein G
MMYQRGFTLIELVVTVAIVGILASALLPLGSLAVKRGKEAELRTSLREIRNGLDAYKKAYEEGRIEKKVDASGYPPNLTLLVEGVPDAKDPKKAKIYFLRRLPRDPWFPDPDVPAAETWGKRSYASPPNDPQPGDDVFDVYSLSADSGINGIPYRLW